MTAAILWWPMHSTDFRTRWVAMPPAMSWEMIYRARKASARPSFCMWEMFTQYTAAQVPSQTHDTSAGAVIVVDPHDTITLPGVTTAQLAARPSDFHFF